MASLEVNVFKRHSFPDVFSRATSQCEPADPANTVTDRLNNLLQKGGDGYVLHLCPNQVYSIQAPISFAHPNQEISTLGYPTGDERAILVVSGPTSGDNSHTTAVSGTCSTCNGVKLRNVQVNGMRENLSLIKGGGNIEMGGSNSGQLIEHVRSYDPRGWSCLHVAEGNLSCNNVTVQNNDIGPCGWDTFQQWADGLSVSCRNAVVKNNMIQDPTDGGIVLFGSPGTRVFNNTVWVVNRTLLGGINLVDYDPWNGTFTGTLVYNNTILGGFAAGNSSSTSKGVNTQDSIIKIAIAIGPRTWFGNKYGNKTVKNGVVRENAISGAVSYGIAVTSAENFVVQSNVLVGNTSFISARGPNCTAGDGLPSPAPFILDSHTTKNLTLQSDFVNINDGDSLTCVLPPNGGDFWPFGLNPSNSSSPFIPGSGSGSSSVNTIAIAVAVVASLLTAAFATFFIRKWILSRKADTELINATKQKQYTSRIL